VIRKADGLRILRNGGFVRFIHRTGVREIVEPDGTTHPLDGRSYPALVDRCSKRTQTGTLRTDDLVIEWRYEP
jgi:hypothetical protein